MTTGQVELLGGARSVRNRGTVMPDVEAPTFDVRKFVENFDVLAELEGGLPRLREFVLELAVRGKLVEQDPSLRPADELLATIAAERTRLVKAGHLRFEKPDDRANVPTPSWSELPEGWTWAKLAELAACEPNAITDGPFGTNLMTEHYIPSPGYTVVRLGNIGVGAYVHGKDAFIPREHFERLSKHHVHSGDLLIAGLAEPVGRSCLVPADLGPALVKADCFRFKPHDALDARYLSNALNSATCRSQAEAANHGITRTRINLGNLKALQVPLPPLAEQKRIVAKVDELMALLDALEAKQARAREAQARLRAAALGALTSAEGPEEFEVAWKRVADNFGTVFDSVAAVEALRRQLVRLAAKGRLSNSATTVSWTPAMVGEVADCLDSLRRPVRKDCRGSEGTSKYPYYGANGQVGHIDGYIFDEPLVLVVEDETFVGRTKPFAYRVDGKCWVNNHAHVLRPKNGVEADFLHLLLAYYPFDEVASGTTGRRKLTKAELLRTPVTLPSIDIQRITVSYLRRLLAECDKLEGKLKKRDETAAKLVEAVVVEMMEG